jgi:kynureninase
VTGPCGKAGREVAAERDAADPLAAFRDRFCWPAQDLIYLDGNSLGPLATRTRDRIAEVIIQEWGSGLIRSWEHWIDLPREAGDELGAALLGAAPGQVLIADNTTVNLYKLACAALGARPARTVLVTDDDNFPTDRYVLQGIAAGRAARLQMIETGIDQGVSAAALGDVLSGDTALVCLSHVAYRSGALADMAALTAMTHDAGALVLWDLCHSAGSVPVQLDACGADLAVGCSYKYLNAGPGAPAFLYVRRELQDQLRQPVWGWFAQNDQFAMGPDFDPVPGIERFGTGTPQVLGTVAVQEGVRLLAEAGLDRLRAKSVALTSYLIELADERLASLGFRVASPRAPASRGGHVTLSHPQAWPISQELIRAGVIGDYRTPDRIRLGPAPLFCRFTDVWDAVDRLRAIAADGCYLEPAAGDRQARVT